MKYKNLAISSVCALIIPVIGYYIGRYTFVDEFPYTGYYHTATILGSVVSNFLLVVGVLGFFFGVISPKFTIWSGPKNRQTVLIVYGTLLAVAFIVRIETTYVSKYIFQGEQTSIFKSFETLRPGMSTKALVEHVRQSDANVIYHFSDTSPFREITGFPYKRDQYVVVFKYPSFYPKFEVQNQIVVEMSAIPNGATATSKRSFLVSGDELIAAYPPISSHEIKTYRGHIFPTVGGNKFRSCSTNKLLEIEEVDQRHGPNGVDVLTEPTYVVFSGVLTGGKPVSTDGKQRESLEILFIHRRGGRLSNIDGRLRLQKDTNGVEQPWDCLNK